MKRPSFQFYPGDWLNDIALRLCSIGARGLWIDILCLMHQGHPYGYLKIKDKILDEEDVATITRINFEEMKSYLLELEENGVLGRDSDRCIFSKRMVKDEIKRNSISFVRSEVGKAGIKKRWNQKHGI